MTPPESRWERYRREVAEAHDFLAPFAPTLSGDVLRAYVVIGTWKPTRYQRGRSVPPEPEATRIKSYAQMRKAGTLGA